MDRQKVFWWRLNGVDVYSFKLPFKVVCKFFVAMSRLLHNLTVDVRYVVRFVDIGGTVDHHC